MGTDGGPWPVGPGSFSDRTDGESDVLLGPGPRIYDLECRTRAVPSPLLNSNRK